ncbi:TIGR03546 family protein [bacterium]|nr:TIGR03546 family protein [bacterium]
MIGLKSISKLAKVLQSDASPWQVAVAAALGVVLGMQPANGPQSLVLFICIFFLNVNIGAAFLSAALFALVGGLLDPVAHKIGYALLSGNETLTPLWTSFANMPIVPFTRFNNTVVLGSLILGLLLFVPVMLATKYLIVYYRARWRDKVAKSKLVSWLKLTKIATLFGFGGLKG